MRPLPLLCCLLALASAAASASQQLYKWKDANGVTQYSQQPPSGAQYETQRISSSGAPVTESAPASDTAADPAESDRCKNARRNLDVLSGSTPVTQDTGKGPEILNDSQRSVQKQLAEAEIAAYCKK